LKESSKKNNKTSNWSTVSNNNNNSQIFPANAGCGEIPMYTILPLRVLNVKGSFPTDPQKTFLKKDFKNHILQKVTNNENAQIKRNPYLESSGLIMRLI